MLSERRVLELAEPGNENVFQYLLDKNVVSSTSREKGRYTEFTLRSEGEVWRAKDRRGQPLQRIPVFQTDIWLADPRVLSTVGVPTPDNVNEVLELAYQLKLISKAKSTWTAAGHLASQLRQHTLSMGSPDNPMLLGLEGVVFLRQVLQEDGFMLREILASLGTPGTRVTRDEVSSKLLQLAEAALRRVEALRASPPAVKEGREFCRLLRETHDRRNQKKGRAGQPDVEKKGGPGVFEHRTSPRMEWLVDFGVLTKEGLAKNAFSYRVGGGIGVLVRAIDDSLGDPLWPDNAALRYWRESSIYEPLRKLRPQADLRRSLLLGYGLVKRSVGPAPIREVCFAAGLLCTSGEIAVDKLAVELVEWSKSESRITLAGGRFTRSPELVYLSPELLAS